MQTTSKTLLISTDPSRTMACPFSTNVEIQMPLTPPQSRSGTPIKEKETEHLLPPPSPPHTPTEEVDEASTLLSQWAPFGLEKPLSTLLKEATVLAHDTVMKEPIVDLLITGQIPRELHVRYLMMLYYVYFALEEALLLHDSHPALAYTYNPALFSRADALAQDIAFFSGDAKWQQSTVAEELGALDWPELADYVHRIRSLSAEERIGADPRDAVHQPAQPVAHLLLAHSYVRYMGDLSGGQSIAKSVAQGYNIMVEDLAFYRFGTLEEPSAAASASETKRTKAWFCQGLDNAGVELSTLQKAELMQEANYAFELNVRLFSSFARLLNQPVAPVEWPVAKPTTFIKASAYATRPAPARTEFAPLSAQHHELALYTLLALLAIFIAYALL